jgi:hypothetical protein
MSRRTSKLTPPVWPSAWPEQTATPQASGWLAPQLIGSLQALPTQPSQWAALASWGLAGTCSACDADLGPGAIYCSQCGGWQDGLPGLRAVAWLRYGQGMSLVPVPVVMLAPKSVGLAAFLELLFPGAGLAYLGRIFPAVFVFFLSLALFVGIATLTDSAQCLGLFVVIWLVVRLGGIIKDTEKYNRQAIGLQY